MAAHRVIWIVVCALVASAQAAPARAGQAAATVVLPFDMLVEAFSPEEIPMPKPAEKKRLSVLGAEVKRMLGESGRYQILDETPLAKEIDDKSPFYKCNGCEVDIAKKLDGTLVVTGLVQKSTESMLNISLYMRRVSDGEAVATVAASVMENTDEGWIRGVRRAIKSRLLNEDTRK